MFSDLQELIVFAFSGIRAIPALLMPVGCFFAIWGLLHMAWRSMNRAVAQAQLARYSALLALLLCCGILWPGYALRYTDEAVIAMPSLNAKNIGAFREHNEHLSPAEKLIALANRNPKAYHPSGCQLLRGRELEETQTSTPLPQLAEACLCNKDGSPNDACKALEISRGLPSPREVSAILHCRDTLRTQVAREHFRNTPLRAWLGQHGLTAGIAALVVACLLTLWLAWRDIRVIPPAVAPSAKLIRHIQLTAPHIIIYHANRKKN